MAAKVFGVVGLVLGATQYRTVGGALLAFDGLLLAAAVGLAVSNGNATKQVEQDQKEMLRQMVAEGTLTQYLIDIRTDSSAGAAAE